MIQKVQTALNFSKKKNSKFGETQVETHSQTDSKFSREVNMVRTRMAQEKLNFLYNLIYWPIYFLIYFFIFEQNFRTIKVQGGIRNCQKLGKIVK